MDVSDINISPAEWEVMRVVWTLGSAGSTEIIHILQQQKQWSESTIKTLLRRQVQKGLLTTTRQGRRFIYTATIAEKKMLELAAANFFNNLCDMQKGHLLIELAQQSPLSKTDIQQLIAVLQQKLPTAPDKVACNCLPQQCRHCAQEEH